MLDSTFWKKAKVAAVITFWGLAAGALAAMPQENWSAAWGNFFGAAFVALGGLLGCLREAKALPERAATWALACIVIGGFVIAGASLQMALAPAT